MENEVGHDDEDAEDPSDSGSWKEDQGQPDSGSEESGDGGAEREMSGRGVLA
jgi:hypothetical protein